MAQAALRASSNSEDVPFSALRRLGWAAMNGGARTAAGDAVVEQPAGHGGPVARFAAQRCDAPRCHEDSGRAVQCVLCGVAAA
jgi:hypothetical protein